MEPTLSAAVRRVLVANANKPMRLNAIWAAVQADAPALARSKTHFKRRIVMGMFHRDELVKYRIPDAAAAAAAAGKKSRALPGGAVAAAPMVYVIRLKGSSRVNATLARQGMVGVDVRGLTLAADKGPAAAGVGAGAAALTSVSPAAAADALR